MCVINCSHVPFKASICFLRLGLKFGVMSSPEVERGKEVLALNTVLTEYIPGSDLFSCVTFFFPY